MNYYSLFRVRSWNNGVRCVSFCILMKQEVDYLQNRNQGCRCMWTYFVLAISVFGFKMDNFCKFSILHLNKSQNTLPWKTPFSTSYSNHKQLSRFINVSDIKRDLVIGFEEWFMIHSLAYSNARKWQRHHVSLCLFSLEQTTSYACLSNLVNYITKI